ncbi:MAG TPA: hypothetical protein VEB19_07420 [Gemmatimonadaceae bacterium]|nr:hypothetical protein [Gemmatimonadaceae bacterium]
MNVHSAVRSSARWVTAVAVCAFWGTACRGSTEPPLRVANPALDSIWIEPFYTRLSARGVLVVMGAPSDTAFRLADDERLLLAVSTSAGDVETFRMGRYLCDGSRDCTGLIVSMEDDYHAGELEERIAHLPVRVYSYSSRTAGARVTEWHRVQYAIAELRRVSGVRLVDRDALGCGSCTSLPLSQTLAGLPLDYTVTPRPNDGLLQLSRGVTVNIRYEQATGVALERNIPIPW